MFIQICINKLTWCHRGDSNKDLIFLPLGHLPAIGADKANIEKMLKKDPEFRCALREE